MKLSKARLKRHMEAEALLSGDAALGHDDRLQVFADWHPGANGNVTWNDAYFTPMELALQAADHIPEHATKILDLCAGIGVLAYALGTGGYDTFTDRKEITCVELSQTHYEIGRRLVPEALWVNKRFQDLDPAAAQYDAVIMNPPFSLARQSVEAALKLSPVVIAILPAGFTGTWNGKVKGQLDCIDLGAETTGEEFECTNIRTSIYRFTRNAEGTAAEKSAKFTHLVEQSAQCWVSANNNGLDQDYDRQEEYQAAAVNLLPRGARATWPGLYPAIHLNGREHWAVSPRIWEEAGEAREASLKIIEARVPAKVIPMDEARQPTPKPTSTPSREQEHQVEKQLALFAA